MSGKDEEKKTPKKVILGSSSYARQQIIGELGYDFTIVTADLDERAIGDRSHASNAEKLVVTLAHAKACEILHKINRHCGDAVLLITGDQVVTYKDKILEKPLSAKEAKEMLLGYCTAPCRTVGSIVITDMVRNVRHDAVFIATIYFKEISEEAMEALIVEGGIMYCAGALMIENKLMEPFIERIEGSIDCVMGLCKRTFNELITQHNRIDTSAGNEREGGVTVPASIRRCTKYEFCNYPNCCT